MANINLNDTGVTVVNSTLTNTNSEYIVNVDSMSSSDVIIVKPIEGKNVKIVSAVRNDTGAAVEFTVSGNELTLVTTSITAKEVTVKYAYL